MNSINRFAAFTLVVMVTMCAGSSAKTLVVGKSAVVCDGATYNPISAALSAASPYDVVEVCADFYPEQLTITKPVTVRGIAIPTSGTRVNRVVIRPVLTGTGSLATITVANTSDV